MFKGSIVALVTPMHTDGSIDQKSLADLIEWHIDCKTAAFVIAGTTGESATLDPDEHLALISFVVEKVAGRIPVIAGTGTNATRSTLKITQNAKEAGADACLVVTPYYNKPTQKGLYEHYRTIAETIDIPLILYNVPGRTACDILPETVAELSQLRNIIGIKEATAKLDRALAIQQLAASDFAIYSGDDLTAFALLQHGAEGVISVTANIAPRKMSAMCEAALNKDFKLAEKINAELMLLHRNLFVESNPIPVKWALQTMDKIQGGIRLPLLPLDKKYYQEVKEAMQHAGV